MVSEKNIKAANELKEEMQKYPVIGVLDMYKLPARQLFEIREKLRGMAKIRMLKKNIIKRALKEMQLKNISELEKYIQGEPAILFSQENPFKLAKIIDSSKSSAFAKEGDVAPKDIVVRAGQTSLPAGPAIGELQKAGLPVMVEEGKIAVKQDTVIAREGDVIDKLKADALAKLGIEPMEIGLNLLAVWEQGVIYPKDILFIPAEKYLEDLKEAFGKAFNLSVAINYYTPENITFLLSKAHSEAKALEINAGVVSPENITFLLSKANTEAKSLENKLSL